ncbi:MAG: tripartite tricarboxylate transporter permease [Sphingomonadaceae bacterium]
MDNLANLMMGFSVALTPENALAALLGAFLGTIIGAMPGIGSSAGIAVLVPISFNYDATTALILMAGVYYGCMYGGTITSVLVNLPGESATVMTCLDGYELAKKGQAGKALGVAQIGSFIWGTLGVVALMLIGPPLAEFALQFGPPEYFALMSVGLVSLAGLGGGSPIKSLMMATFGLLLSQIGTDPVGGAARFTFNNVAFLNGVEFIPVAVGLFAIGELLITAEEKISLEFKKFSLLSMFPSKSEWKRCMGSWARGGITGFLIGALPGAGATISSFMAYSLEKKVSKHPEKFGTGILEGVAAPEAANNAATAGAIIHLLTLGVPGSGSTAVMLGALMMHGLRPGPLLFQQNPEFVWALIASMYIGNVALLVMNMPLVPVFTSILKLPYPVLLPIIMVVSMIGVFSINNSMFDLWVMFLFGVLGYFFKKFQYPVAPLVLALVLGDMVERSLRQSLAMSQNDPSIFVTRPISGVLLLIGLLALCVPIFQALWSSRKKAAAAA